MKRYLILGAGRQGVAAAWELMRHGEVMLADASPEQLDRALSQLALPADRGVQTDLADEKGVRPLMAEADGVLFAADYSLNLALTRWAIEEGCSAVDYGGNHDVVAAQHELNDAARAAGVAVLPDTGLTPGLAGILVAGGMAGLDAPLRARIRVGGLPLEPEPPLNYALVFSVRGLTNEYLEPSRLIEGGQVLHRPSLSGLEELEFDGRRLEAFYTSGGVSTLPESFGDRLDLLDCKTLRYPGHAELIRFAFELGFRSEEWVEQGEQRFQPRAAFEQMLSHSLPHNPPDEVLMRVSVEGNKAGRGLRVVYEMHDRYDETTGFTAMQRCTAWPGSILLRQAVQGQLSQRGVLYQERVVDVEGLVAELGELGIEIQRHEQEA